MGAYSSTHLSSEEVEEICAHTNFTSKEIEQLYHRFKKLDRSRTGLISQKDFNLISELSLNPMAPRILSMFRTPTSTSTESGAGEECLEVSGGVTFDAFVRCLNLFHVRTSIDERSEALFRAWDVDADGRVGEADLGRILRLYTGPHLSDACVRVLVKNTMKQWRQKCEMREWREGKNQESNNNNNNTNTAALRNRKHSQQDVKKQQKKDPGTILPQSTHGGDVDGDGPSTPSSRDGLTLVEWRYVMGDENIASLNVAIPLRDE